MCFPACIAWGSCYFDCLIILHALLFSTLHLISAWSNAEIQANCAHEALSKCLLWNGPNPLLLVSLLIPIADPRPSSPPIMSLALNIMSLLIVLIPPKFLLTACSSLFVCRCSVSCLSIETQKQVCLSVYVLQCALIVKSMSYFKKLAPSDFFCYPLPPTPAICTMCNNVTGSRNRSLCFEQYHRSGSAVITTICPSYDFSRQCAAFQEVSQTYHSCLWQGTTVHSETVLGVF